MDARAEVENETDYSDSTAGRCERTDRITTCNVGSNVCECTGDDFTLDISTYAKYP